MMENLDFNRHHLVCQSAPLGEGAKCEVQIVLLKRSTQLSVCMCELWISVLGLTSAKHRVNF